MRLIDADRALEIVRDQRIAHPNAYHLTNYATLILQEAPTIEAEPVRHGWWKECFEQDGERAGYCSECHAIRFVDPFCPKCGARMDGESE